MPTYQYECKKCGHRFERFQTITAPPLKTCPACRGRVDRLISGGAGFLFKGSGFYTTDYRSESYKQREKADREAASPPDKKKETDGSTKENSTARAAAS